MNINAYATLVEKSNSKGIKALMAKRKLKKATCEMSHNSSYAKEFEGLYVSEPLGSRNGQKSCGAIPAPANSVMYGISIGHLKCPSI